MDQDAVMAALAAELEDMARRLTRLQDSPLVGACASLSGEALTEAMVAMQDLDLLTQTASGLAEFAKALEDAAWTGADVQSALGTLTLHSLATRLQKRIEA